MNISPPRRLSYPKSPPPHLQSLLSPRSASPSRIAGPPLSSSSSLTTSPSPAESSFSSTRNKKASSGSITPTASGSLPGVPHTLNPGNKMAKAVKTASRGTAPTPTEQSPLLGGTAGPQAEFTADNIAEEADIEPAVTKDGNAANQTISSARGGAIVFSLWLLIFLQASNMSGLTTAQSAIAAELDAFSEASWFTSAYLIAASSLAPVAGRLSQIFSPRSCIIVYALIFALGGLVTSQAHSLAGFLVGRAISGVGAAGILTLSIILILELTSKDRRGLFIGLMNAGFTSGVALGAVVAGALVPVVGWRPLFWAQTPIALLAGIGLFFGIPKEFVSGPQSSEKLGVKLARIDYLGAVTLTCSIVSFLIGLASPTVEWIPIVISVVLLAVFVANEFYVAADPIIPVVILTSRPVLLCCLAQLGFMCARWMILFYSPVFGIAIRGWPLAKAGSILVSTNVGFALGGLLVGWLHIKRAGSFWGACVVSFGLFAISVLLLAQLSTPTAPAALYICVAALNGLATGAALNYTLAHALHLSPPAAHFVVTSLVATFRGFAGSFGSAISAGVFARLLRRGLVAGWAARGELRGKEALLRRLLGSPALVNTLDGADRAVAVAAYTQAVRGLFVAGAALAAVMVLVQAGTGWVAGSDARKGGAEPTAAAVEVGGADEES